MNTESSCRSGGHSWTLGASCLRKTMFCRPWDHGPYNISPTSGDAGDGGQPCGGQPCLWDGYLVSSLHIKAQELLHLVTHTCVVIHDCWRNEERSPHGSTRRDPLTAGPDVCRCLTLLCILLWGATNRRVSVVHQTENQPPRCHCVEIHLQPSFQDA